MKIVSGGQTGVDRAALDAAIKLKMNYGGWCPKGRKSEDGLIPKSYLLQETPSDDYSQRTEWNVRDSDGTLILTWGEATGGTKLTWDLAAKLKKPFFVVDFENEPAYRNILDWIQNRRISILNVAGPRESNRPGTIYEKSFEFLCSLFLSSDATLRK